MKSRNRSQRSRVALVGLLATGLATLAAPVAAQALPKEGKVKVMSRNVYLGADLTPALTAGTPIELALAAQDIWNDVHTTDFPQRAKLLAREIRNNRPDLVGLQEVALWRGDFNPPTGDGPSTPAETVEFDFLELLLARLNKPKKGPDYKVVRKQREADIEAPLSAGNPGDGRLTMRDVVLKRKRAQIQTRRHWSSRFEKENSLVVEDIGGVVGFDVTVWRGWIGIDAVVRGTPFRFVNTHLEAFDNDAKLGQAEELVAALPEEIGPANPDGTDHPVVLVGDLNSDDEIVETGSGVVADEAPYAEIVGAGLEERSFDGLNTDGLDAEFSCCFSAELIDEPPPGALADIDHTVDHVMVSDDDPGEGVDPNSNDVELVKSFPTGNDPAQFAGIGRWASDHLGVFSVLQFP